MANVRFFCARKLIVHYHQRWIARFFYGLKLGDHPIWRGVYRARFGDRNCRRENSSSRAKLTELGTQYEQGNGQPLEVRMVATGLFGKLGVQKMFGKPLDGWVIVEIKRKLFNRDKLGDRVGCVTIILSIVINNSA